MNFLKENLDKITLSLDGNYEYMKRNRIKDEKV